MTKETYWLQKELIKITKVNNVKVSNQQSLKIMGLICRMPNANAECEMHSLFAVRFYLLYRAIY